VIHREPWRAAAACRASSGTRELKVFPQRSNDALGRFLLEPLHNQGSGFGGLGLDQHMKMLGHQNPADGQEMPFLPHLVKPLDKAKAIREEKWRAAIGAGGEELEFTGTVNAVVKGHGAGEHTLDGARSEENVPAGERRHQKSGAPADDFDFRYNARDVSDGERTEKAIQSVVGKRLMYRTRLGSQN
jgi:hypothetical protein